MDGEAGAGLPNCGWVGQPGACGAEAPNGSSPGRRRGAAPDGPYRPLLRAMFTPTFSPAAPLIRRLPHLRGRKHTQKLQPRGQHLGIGLDQGEASSCECPVGRLNKAQMWRIVATSILTVKSRRQII